MALNLHGQAADVDGVHFFRQALLGLQNQGVRVPLEGPTPDIVLADLERQVIRDEDQPAARGSSKGGIGDGCRRRAIGSRRAHLEVFVPCMSSMDVLLPFTWPACDSGPPPCSSPMLPPKSPCAKAARLLNDCRENCMLRS